MKKLYKLLAGLFVCTLLTGCVSATASEAEKGVTPLNTEDLFSNRDSDWVYETEEYAEIILQNESVMVDKEGVYVLKGSLENGQIIVDAAKDEKVQLVLDGVSVVSKDSAALYIKQADKVFVTLSPGSENLLENGGNFMQTDENNVDAALFSKEDLTLNGEGKLKIISPAGHGIVSKDELTVTGGSLEIEASGHGLSGQDNVCISGGSFAITAGKDGIHAEHDEDAARGFVYLAGGIFAITAEGDGISASGMMQIEDGNFAVTTGGGSENGEVHTSGFGMGGFGGGSGRGGRGGFGGFAPGMPPDFAEMNENENADAEPVTVSMKGIKGENIYICGGHFSLNTADDALHANASLQLDGGVFSLASGDDGVHAEETLIVNGGDMTISKSYEGLEALHIRLNGGYTTLNADDDGLNAAGGTDQSGFGGRDQFGGFGGRGGLGGRGAGNGSIEITGGEVHITAYGDGIDANGYLKMTGGFVTVCGPIRGDTATLDYDTTAEIDGGTFIGSGAMGMAQTFSGGTQGVIAVQVGSAPADTAVTLLDADQKQVLSYAPPLEFNVLILSSPDIVKGETYTLQVNDGRGTFTAQ